MNEIRFSELDLLPEVAQAISEMGFETATKIQSEAIPPLRAGRDIIGRSQTGTGKTLAFAIPAIERIDRSESETTVQVLILCPTRELAQQGCEEIRKLTRFLQGIWITDVYGGAPMDRQIAHLRKCNLVIGTPGRVMDHMRRGTLSLENVKLVVLDEADEMLSMGFREDIETILKDVPEAHQTALFSATMPDPILEITETYLTEPHMIEINREQVTLENIRQSFVDVPMGRKLDALNLILRAYEPKLCMIFCNTKLMVEEVTQYLHKCGFPVEALHGDLNQSQRTRVMEGFKSARIPLLVATDVAARGIDVNDIDYVINYDVPSHDEYYIHRIGRTGRAGKEGCALTICSGRRQLQLIRELAQMAKSEIAQVPIPKVADIRKKHLDRSRDAIVEILKGGVSADYLDIAASLAETEFEPVTIAAAALQYAFKREELDLHDIEFERKAYDNSAYRKLLLGVGRRQRVAPNHIVSAVAERANIPGREIGKIDIFDERSLVGIPAAKAEQAARRLQGLKINGFEASVKLLPEQPSGERRAPMPMRDRRDSRAEQTQPPRRGKMKISEAAKARLLSDVDLERFELGKGKKRETERREPARSAGNRKSLYPPRGPKHPEKGGHRDHGRKK